MQFSLNRIYLRFKQIFFFLRVLRCYFNVYFRIFYTLLQSLSDDLNICTVIIVYSFCHLIHFHSAALYFEPSLMYLDLGLAKQRTQSREQILQKDFLALHLIPPASPPPPQSPFLLSFLSPPYRRAERGGTLFGEPDYHECM